MSAHTELPWLPFRNDLKDFLDLTHKRNFIHAMSEVDITKLTQRFEERKKEGNNATSVTAYMMWALGQAIKQHPEVQAMKKGDKLIAFDDVDIASMIEKELPGGKKIPFPYIFRAVQTRTFDELSKEMFDAKQMDLEELKKRKKSKIIRSFPKFLRMFILKRALKDPFKFKEVLGTVAMTSLGMMMTNRKFHPVPIGPYSITLAVGGSYIKKEADGEKKMLCMTLVIDHDISDGAPIARFGNTLFELIESASGVK